MYIFYILKTASHAFLTCTASHGFGVYNMYKV